MTKTIKANVNQLSVGADVLSTEKEIWKDIEYYEGLYQVSNLGRVKRVDKGLVLKGSIASRSSLIQVALHRNGYREDHFVHRLVFHAFNPDSGQESKVIKHLDGDTTNNTLSNLYVGHKYINKISNSLSGKRITKDMLSELSLQDYIGEVVLITVDVVAGQNHLNRMFNFDDLKSYLVIQAMEIVNKFDPEKCEDGWGTLGQYLYRCLNGRAINFKKKSFKDNERYAALEVKADEDFDDEHSETLLSEESGYSEVLGTDMMTVLSDELSPFQLDILKGRLEGQSDSEIGRALGVHSMKVYREMKKVQAIAIELGFLN